MMKKLNLHSPVSNQSVLEKETSSAVFFLVSNNDDDRVNSKFHVLVGNLINVHNILFSESHTFVCYQNRKIIPKKMCANLCSNIQKTK